MESTPKTESSAESLISHLDSILWENEFEFTYNGIDFKLHISTIEEINQNPASYGEPAEYSRSTETDGYDIYLHDSVPETDRKRVLFHEIMEASLGHSGMDVDEAHQITLAEEEKIFGKRD